MTPEGKIKKLVKDVLNTAGAYYFMPVQNGMGMPGLDFYCCFKGRFFAIETKAPGKKMSPRQLATADDIVAGGGTIFVVDGDVSLKYVVDWINNGGKL